MNSVNLKDIAKIRPEGEREDGIFVPWGDESDTPEFKISYMGREIIKKARKAALTNSWSKKAHRMEENIDEDKLDKVLMELSVVGWKGLKVKHLKEILDPSSVVLETDSENMEAEVEYNPENKDIIITHYNLSFSRFVSGISLEVDTYRKYKEEQLRKNSSGSQAG